MTTVRSDSLGVVLLAMGGPDTVADVRQYLLNIFSDRSIIRLPGGRHMQKIMARIIAGRRRKKIEAHYRLIGGGSPLRRWTQAQADHVQHILSETMSGVRCYIGMRYFTPSIEQAIKQAYSDGCRRLVFLPLYPQYCRATTGSSFEEAARHLERFTDIEAEYISDFHDHPDYVDLLQAQIDRNVAPGETLLFSAHAIPEKLVEEGDPYVDQVRRLAAMVAGDRKYYLSFQSRSGPVKWVGPDTREGSLRRARENKRGLFVVPISFVCDHIETLYEIDIELRNLVLDKTGVKLRRMPMFNDDPRFAQVLANLVLKKVTANV